MGLATARALARRGLHVTIAGRSPVRLAEAAAVLDGPADTVAVDVTRDDDVARLAAGIDRLDHLVITASGALLGNLLDVAPALVREFWEGKFWGPYRLVRALAPRMTPPGSITLFSGAAARRASPGFAFGSALNAAIEALGTSLAAELAPLRVNTVSPGIIATPIWDVMMAPEARDRFFSDTAARLPARRVGTPEDIAGAVLFLIENGYTTGSIVTVDGGYLVS
jgi:NAD(P)-dependent dehydrogenase (short-subunit alcohol dehydrogenase family)